MRSAHLGILVLDMLHSEVLFLNDDVAEIVRRAGCEPEFGTLCELFSVRADRTPEPVSTVAREVQLGTRKIGFTSYGASRFVWIFCRDITEKLRLEAIAEATESMNSIGSVISAVRHEIGNPVNSAKMALSVLLRDYDRFSKDAVLQYISRCLAELGRVEDLLRSLRTFNMYEDLAPSSVNLGRFLDQFQRFVGPDFTNRGIKLVVRHGGGEELVKADPRGLQQILLNLLANAADALSGRVDPRISIQVRFLNGYALLEIEDNGCGISDDARAMLFKPFGTTKPNGTGLGLTLARKMLARMDGTIEIASQVGVGTRVTLTMLHVGHTP